MRDYQIYLVGGMSNFGKDNFDEGNMWRRYCTDELNKIQCDYNLKIINPNNYFNFIEEPKRYASEREIMEFDLHKVKTSDLIIINFNDMYSLGSMAKLAIAYEKRIPVIGLDIHNKILHPWQIEMCTRVFNNVNEMLDYVKDFYLT